MLTVDRDVEVDVRGLPICEGKKHPIRRDLREVIRECREAIVGSGKAKVMVSFPELTPIRVSSRLAAFNGGVRGGSKTLFVVGEIRIPVPALIAAEVVLRRSGGGWRAVVKIPRIAGGAGSLTAFRLNLKRFFSYRGKRKSFLSARCPDGDLGLSMQKLLFKNEARIRGVPAQTVMKGRLAIPCAPRR